MGSFPDTDIDPHLVTFVSQGLFLWRHYINYVSLRNVDGSMQSGQSSLKVFLSTLKHI